METTRYLVHFFFDVIFIVTTGHKAGLWFAHAVHSVMRHGTRFYALVAFFFRDASVETTFQGGVGAQTPAQRAGALVITLFVLFPLP